MFDIRVEFQDIEISSIEKEDLGSIYKWYLQEEKNTYELGDETISEEGFYERFLEYYVSECEFFLKVLKNGEMIGMVKGRVDFKNPNEVWIGYILLHYPLRGRGLGSKILKKIMGYFCRECGICNFYVKVHERKNSFLNFLKKNKFQLIRYSQSSLGESGNGILFLGRII